MFFLARFRLRSLASGCSSCVSPRRFWFSSHFLRGGLGSRVRFTSCSPVPFHGAQALSPYSAHFLVRQWIPWTLFLRLLVSGSHWCGALKSTGIWNFPGDDFGPVSTSCALPGSTVDTCTASVDVAFGRISRIFCVKVTSDPEVDLPFALGDDFFCFRIRRDGGYMFASAYGCLLDEFPTFS